MEFTRGGKTIEFDTTPILPPDAKPLSHNAFMLWDCFCSLITHRAVAVDSWKRRQKLVRLVAAHPGHENNAIAESRIEKLDSQIRDSQLKFLKSEEYAQGYWSLISQRDRIQEALHELYNVEPNVSHITPLWNRPLGESSKGAPKECKISQTVLMFCSPSIAKVYRKAVGS
jgi:hypothetical protein